MKVMTRRNAGRSLLGGLDTNAKFRGPGIISKKGCSQKLGPGVMDFDLGPGVMDMDLGPGIIS